MKARRNQAKYIYTNKYIYDEIIFITKQITFLNVAEKNKEMKVIIIQDLTSAFALENPCSFRDDVFAAHQTQESICRDVPKAK